MKTFVKNLAQSYFNENRETFGEEAIFVTLILGEKFRKVTVAELSYTITAGTIIYRESTRASGHLSTNLLIKYFDATGSPPGLVPGFASFSQELHFLRSTLPTFDAAKPIRHLFPSFCASAVIATRSTNRNVVFFEWPLKADLGKAFPLGFSRGLLMVKRIAELHASSLLLQRNDAQLFENLNCAYLERTLFHAPSVLHVLLNCLQPLYADHRYETGSSEHFREGVTRLQRLLDDFDDRLNVPFARARAGDLCWVWCHRDYSQESVVFELASNKSPADVKIFNCQSMGLASLGVDLVVPLFVEIQRGVRSRYVKKLLRQYHVELHASCEGPTYESILSEVHKCVPVALYVLARRIIRVQSQTASSTQSLFERKVWKESLITDLYRYLIEFKYV
ncbi:hypothetical protein V9T40_007740 [Parthenolecanium corni]|uniref:CHK kinase-like domain-containing protein n=1 Tax=Parthenolecanium corni TaxID=536013 RepID=A0AAN9Y652_9HEMI